MGKSPQAAPSSGGGLSFLSILEIVVPVVVAIIVATFVLSSKISSLETGLADTKSIVESNKNDAKTAANQGATEVKADVKSARDSTDAAFSKLEGKLDKAIDRLGEQGDRLTRVETKLEPLARDVDTIRTTVGRFGTVAQETVREEMRNRITWVQYGVLKQDNLSPAGGLAFDWKLVKPVRREMVIDIQADTIEPISGTIVTGEILENGATCRMTVTGNVTDEQIKKGIPAKVIVTQRGL